MRKLVACLACRLAGSRLYGKPLQNLDVEKGISILQHQVEMLRSVDAIHDVVLGIAEGDENLAVVQFAQEHDLAWITGDEKDVLSRLISCVDAVEGTDVFRITTESPFTFHELIDEAWREHTQGDFDVTVVDGVALGSGFEIFTADSLKVSHSRGDSRHRSELCSLYIRENRDQFRINLLDIPAFAARPELRLTVDYPEDLIVCRAVYRELKRAAPMLPMSGIVEFLDSHPELTDSLAKFGTSGAIWD